MQDRLEATHATHTAHSRRTCQFLLCLDHACLARRQQTRHVRCIHESSSYNLEWVHDTSLDHVHVFALARIVAHGKLDCAAVLAQLAC